MLTSNVRLEIFEDAKLRRFFGPRREKLIGG
jgi:hypothetical protein